MLSLLQSLEPRLFRCSLLGVDTSADMESCSSSFSPLAKVQNTRKGQSSNNGPMSII